MKIKQYVAFALMGLALGACKKPGGEGPEGPDSDTEKTGRLKLSFALPNRITTYAAGDDVNSTTEEATISTVDVFVYEDGGSFALDYFDLTSADFTRVGGTATNQYTLNTASILDVRPGRKQVYVGINLPSHIVDRLKAGHYINEVYSSIVAGTPNSDALIGNGGSGNIAFFNRTFRDGETTIDDAINVVDVAETGTTEFEIEVDRLVAKIVVTVSQGFENSLFGGSDEKSISGGKFSDLSFTIGQRNKNIFVSPLVASGTDPNGADPNYGVGSAGNIGDSDYQLIEGIDVDVNGWEAVNSYAQSQIINWLGETSTTAVYAPENTIEWTGSDPTTAQHQDATYVSVRARFTPDVIDDGGALTGNTFYAVFTGNDDDRGMGQRYFSTQVAARDFVKSDDFVVDILGLTSGDLDDDADADKYIHIYDSGYCYFRLYLNPNLNYSILRNTVYRATITGINYIGTTSPEILPGSDNTPTNPSGVPDAAIPGVTYPVLPTHLIQNLQRDELLDGEIHIMPWQAPAAVEYELQ